MSRKIISLNEQTSLNDQKKDNWAKKYFKLAENCWKSKKITEISNKKNGWNEQKNSSNEQRKLLKWAKHTSNEP